MFKMNLEPVERVYANNGQHAEYAMRKNITGKAILADNLPATAGADVLDIQVKSFHATVCKGTDIRAHVEQDKAQRYAYVTKDFATAYIMSPAEYIDFVDTFGTLDHDSNGKRATAGHTTLNGHHGGASGSNGGGVKIRLKRCEPAMIAWFEERM